LRLCGELTGLSPDPVPNVPRTISDEDGPTVADTFYEYLFRENNSTVPNVFRPDINAAAGALHVAVAKLRAEGVSFKRWVPFIHLGR
jgi:hypothetical protein